MPNFTQGYGSPSLMLGQGLGALNNGYWSGMGMANQMNMARMMMLGNLQYKQALANAALQRGKWYDSGIDPNSGQRYNDETRREYEVGGGIGGPTSLSGDPHGVQYNGNNIDPNSVPSSDLANMGYPASSTQNGQSSPGGMLGVRTGAVRAQSIGKYLQAVKDTQGMDSNKSAPFLKQLRTDLGLSDADLSSYGLPLNPIQEATVGSKNTKSREDILKYVSQLKDPTDQALAIKNMDPEGRLNIGIPGVTQIGENSYPISGPGPVVNGQATSLPDYKEPILQPPYSETNPQKLSDYLKQEQAKAAHANVPLVQNKADLARIQAQYLPKMDNATILEKDRLGRAALGNMGANNTRAGAYAGPYADIARGNMGANQTRAGAYAGPYADAATLNSQGHASTANTGVINSKLNYVKTIAQQKQNAEQQINNARDKRNAITALYTDKNGTVSSLSSKDAKTVHDLDQNIQDLLPRQKQLNDKLFSAQKDYENTLKNPPSAQNTGPASTGAKGNSLIPIKDKRGNTHMVTMAQLQQLRNKIKR